MTFAPILTWGLRQQRTAADLRRRLHISRAAHAAALLAVARKEAQIAELGQQLQQTRGYEPCVIDATGRCTRWSHDHRTVTS